MTNDKARTATEVKLPCTTACPKPSRRFSTKLLTSLFVIIAVGCSKENSTETIQTTGKPAEASMLHTNAASASERQVFQVRGVVQEVRLADNEVVIKHEEIPNFMPAMTMPFEVKNTNELTGLAPNDQVTFSMIVTEDDGWIESVKKTGVDATSQGQQPRPSTRVVREVEALAVGDQMPNYPFTNSLGQKVELKDFAGQAYALTFIFTRCPFPTFCPRMNTNFEKAYEQLKNMPDAPTNWHLISISFDPDFDTPERLREYSKTYKPDPKKWSWVTGAMIEIDAITEQLGVVFAFENNTINHNLRTAVIDKNGVIRQIFWGNEWTSEQLVEELIAGAQGKELAAPSQTTHQPAQTLE